MQYFFAIILDGEIKGTLTPHFVLFNSEINNVAKDFWGTLSTLPYNIFLLFGWWNIWNPNSPLRLVQLWHEHHFLFFFLTQALKWEDMIATSQCSSCWRCSLHTFPCATCFLFFSFCETWKQSPWSDIGESVMIASVGEPDPSVRGCTSPSRRHYRLHCDGHRHDHDHNHWYQYCFLLIIINLILFQSLESIGGVA